MFSYVFMKILEGRPSSYDRLMERASRGRVRAAKEAVAAEIPEGAGVLEIGCGTGELAEILAGRGCTVEGFDINPAMVAAARKRIREKGLGRAFSVREMGVEGMDTLPARGYDAAVATLVFSELNPSERRFALEHLFRVLKGGGRLVVADEVVPRGWILRLLHAASRAPAAALTYLVARETSRPLRNIAFELEEAGFTIERELRSRGDAFALIVARRPEKESGS